MTKLILAAAAVSFLAFPAFAQECAPAADAERFLRDTHGEEIVSYGLIPSGALMQLWASPNGSWTIIITDGNISCVVVHGSDYAQMAAKPNL